MSETDGMERAEGRAVGSIDPEHPEATCQDCGFTNINWWVDSDLWNAVMPVVGAIVCPVCFALRAQAKGVYDRSWRLMARTHPEPLAGEVEEAYGVEAGESFLHTAADWVGAQLRRRVIGPWLPVVTDDYHIEYANGGGLYAPPPAVMDAEGCTWLDPRRCPTHGPVEPADD